MLSNWRFAFFLNTTLYASATRSLESSHRGDSNIRLLKYTCDKICQDNKRLFVITSNWESGEIQGLSTPIVNSAKVRLSNRLTPKRACPLDRKHWRLYSSLTDVLLRCFHSLKWKGEIQLSLASIGICFNITYAEQKQDKIYQMLMHLTRTSLLRKAYTMEIPSWLCCWWYKPLKLGRRWFSAQI